MSQDFHSSLASASLRAAGQPSTETWIDRAWANRIGREYRSCSSPSLAR